MSEQDELNEFRNILLELDLSKINNKRFSTMLMAYFSSVIAGGGFPKSVSETLVNDIMLFYSVAKDMNVGDSQHS